MPTIRREIRGKILEIKRVPLFKIFGGTIMWLKFKRIEEDSDGKEQRLRSNTPERESAPGLET